MNILKNKIDWLLISSLILITVSLWIPTINTPYWWDSAGFVIQSARQFVNSNFWPLAINFSNFAHPPFFILLLALLWRIFGESLFVSHTLNLLFTLLTITYAYLLGRNLIKDKSLGGMIGFVSSLFLLFTPVFLVQVGIIYLEIPTTALAVASYYYFLKQNYFTYSVFATLMVLTKEISVFISILFLIIFTARFFFHKQKRVNTTEIIRNLFYFLLPIAALLGWFIYHNSVLGWGIIAPNRQLQGVNLQMNANNMLFTFIFIFFGQYRFIFSLIIFYPLILLSGNRTILKKYLNRWTIEILPLVIIPILYSLFFGKTEFLQRYCIIMLPFYYLLAFFNFVFFLKELPEKYTLFTRIAGSLLVLATLFFFHSAWDEHRKITAFNLWPLEDNLEYLNVINVGKQAATYLEQSHPTAHVFASFPFNYMLTQTYQHYVTKPITENECSQYKKGEHVDFVVIHFFSAGEMNCMRLANKLQYKNYKIFQENGKYVILASKDKNSHK